MVDRFLSIALRLTILSLITLSAGVSLFVGYGGVLDMVTGHYSAGSALVGVSLLMGTGSYLVCRHGNDLIDR